MSTSTTKSPFRVVTDPGVGSSITVTTDQLPRLRAILDEAGKFVLHVRQVGHFHMATLAR